MMNDTVKKLACMVGEFSKFDQKDGKHENYKFARCRVWLNAARPIVTGFELTRRNKDPIWVKVKYERIPRFCYHCGLWTHELEDCDRKAQSRLAHYEEWIKTLASIDEKVEENEEADSGEQEVRHGNEEVVKPVDGGQKERPAERSDLGEEGCQTLLQVPRGDRKSNLINGKRAQTSCFEKVSSPFRGQKLLEELGEMQDWADPSSLLGREGMDWERQEVSESNSGNNTYWTLSLSESNDRGVRNQLRLDKIQSSSDRFEEEGKRKSEKHGSNRFAGRLGSNKDQSSG
ncbi:hypothetical protein QQ045_020111 [Rhodiola kirilowii]